MASRQAIVVIHGMGEQRPVETLNQFSQVIVPEGQRWFSKADKLGVSPEGRRHLLPAKGQNGIQTEIFEYHWAHLMQGNRLSDLFPVVRRTLLPVPGWWGPVASGAYLAALFLLFVSRIEPKAPQLTSLVQILLLVGSWAGTFLVLRYVPTGLRLLWLLLWFGIGSVVWALLWGPFHEVLSLQGALPEEFRISDVIDSVIRAIIGGGITALFVAFLITRAVPNWLTSSFVDVVRYLDTSPRSYEMRRNIREGMVDLLERLHNDDRFQRIVIVAHSLGSYIGYDAISYLWARTSKLHKGASTSRDLGEGLGGLLELEKAASALCEWWLSRNRRERRRCQADLRALVESYQKAQRNLWVGIRTQGNPWLITDFITFGSPMYFADKLVTRDRRQFKMRIERHELVTCPPENELKNTNNINCQTKFFTWENHGRRVLHDGAPFAVVRWTNLWYRPWAWFFGDWFGGSLAPLYGPGIKEVTITGNRPVRWLPGFAHALYLYLPGQLLRWLFNRLAKDFRKEESFAGCLATALCLDAADWLPKDPPKVDPNTQRSDPMIL